ncbi:MAG: YkgJ family cysteine cluster protein [Lachnospiraceae bacterium]|nr:YkgJ family cysteine cluster protein [Lachnospiraceae bacterium]MDY4971262.1 YkgJ family cysteine cluster protein [Lachnospiraceae bacterium]
MKRTVDMREISDGRLYGLNDMVKADCGDCQGCSACCRGMGNSVILDPMDLYRMTTGLHADFQTLMNGYIELNMVDGIILPNLKMSGTEEKCAFLSEEGRCRIHTFRPGICRLFPLGRIYREEERGFDYFLQIHECKKENRSKVKVRKWIDTPDVKQYEKFIEDWHYFLEDTAQKVKNCSGEEKKKEYIMPILSVFYVQPYDNRDFYSQFYSRLDTCQDIYKRIQVRV